MKDFLLLCVLMMNVRLSCCCYEEKDVLFCFSVPSGFRPGYTTLVLFLKEVGQLNSTALLSSNLTSVTRLRINSAGVTGVADGAFSSLQKLLSLSLEQNLLTHMSPKWLSRPELLQELNLSGNRIQVLSESMFSGLKNLLKLILSNNWIRGIDPNSFSSLTNLTDLDLSGNRLTKLLPRVLHSVWSSRLRLDQNPWDCSCDAQVFMVLLREVQNRSLLLQDREVTCQTPPSLTGQAVWRVTECGAPLPSPPPTSDPAAQSLSISPDNVAPTLPFLSSGSDPTSQSPSESTPSQGQNPSDLRPTSVTEKSSQQTSNVISRLVAATVVLSVLLGIVCLLAGLQRRNHSSNTVKPRCEGVEEEHPEVTTQLEPFGASEVMRRSLQDTEVGAGERVRCQSAKAVLVTSPFSLPGNHFVSHKTEVQGSTDVSPHGEASLGADDLRGENVGGCNSDHRDSYLSIGAEQNPSQVGEEPCQQHAGRGGLEPQMCRISTWPPTAAQWRERCRRERQEEESGAGPLGDGVLKAFGSVEQEVENETKKGEEISGGRIFESGELEVDDEVDAPKHNSDPDTGSDPEQELQNQTEPRAEFMEARDSPASESADARENREGAGSIEVPRSHSSGDSPHNESVLHAVEAPVMDLLHEVVQNHGRWTRERWRQSRMHK